MRRPTSSTLFPYTTLFRSRREQLAGEPEPFACPAEEVLQLRPLERPLGVARRHGIDVRGARHLLPAQDRKSTRLNSSHTVISYAVFCLKKKRNRITTIIHA